MFCRMSVVMVVGVGNSGVKEDSEVNPGAFGAETETVVGIPGKTEGTAADGNCNRFDKTLLTAPPRLTIGRILPVVVGTSTEFA